MNTDETTAPPAGDASETLPSHVEASTPGEVATATVKLTAPAPMHTWEKWAAAKKLPAWQLAAARHHAAWPAGREVTEADFDKAVTEALNARIG